MHSDPKREMLRHLLATVWFRGRIAVADAPPEFADFRVVDDSRSAGELLAHIGDLLEGSFHLLRGEFVELRSDPLPWAKEVERFASSIRHLDGLLASDSRLAYPVERFIQGPVGDALTHIGQLVLLRRVAGCPVTEAPYFTAEITAGRFDA